MPVTKDEDFYPTKSKHELYYPSPPIVQLILTKDLHSRCYGRSYTFAFLKGSAVPYIVLLSTLHVLAFKCLKEAITLRPALFKYIRRNSHF